MNSDLIDYEDVLRRISTVYNSCSKMEQKMLLNILKEIQKHGYSQTLEQLWLTDFKEVPVSIDEFISSPMYLGETNRMGKAVYPFWRETLGNIFNAGNKYSEIILSGATRIGKTSTAVIIMAYMLYRLMLYRNPHEYFKKKEVSRFTIAFANITKDLAQGVAYRETMDTLKASEWFNQHGKFSRSERNFYYIPEGDKIDVVAASDATHMLGMQLWCLTKDSIVITQEGPEKIENLDGKTVTLPQLDLESNSIVYCEASVALTKYTDTTIRLTLEDGTVIEGTPEHKVLLKSGIYKQLSEITEEDELFTVDDSTCVEL